MSASPLTPEQLEAVRQAILADPDRVAELLAAKAMPPAPLAKAETETAIIAVAPTLAPQDNPAVAYLLKVTERTARTVRADLCLIVDVLTNDAQAADPDRWMRYPWHLMTETETELVRNRLQARTYMRAGQFRQYTPKTINRVLTHMRAVLRQAKRKGLMSSDHFDRITDFDPVRGETLPAGRHIEEDEFKRLLVSISRDPDQRARRRDAAIVALLYGAGLRRAELAAMDLADYDPQTTTIRILHGKGRKQRALSLACNLEAYLDAWIAERGDAPGPLFTPVRRDADGNYPLRRLSTNAVYDAVQARAAEARITRIGCHDFRRTFIGNLLDTGDASAAQKAAGHASIQTTLGYDRRPAKAMRKAIATINLPIVTV